MEVEVAHEMQMKKNQKLHFTRVPPGGTGLLRSVTGSMDAVGSVGKGRVVVSAVGSSEVVVVDDVGLGLPIS